MINDQNFFIYKIRFCGIFCPVFSKTRRCHFSKTRRRLFSTTRRVFSNLSSIQFFRLFKIVVVYLAIFVVYLANPLLTNRNTKIINELTT